MKKRNVEVAPGKYTRTRKKIGSARADDTDNLNWYEEPEETLFQKVFGRVRTIKAAQVTRRYERFLYQQAYNSRFGPSAMMTLFAPSSRNTSSGINALTANVIKSCIDTAVARVAKENSRPFLLPKTGDYRVKKKCQDGTKYVDGVFEDAKVYSKGQLVFRDACIYGDGYLIFREKNGKIVSDVVKVDEWILDEVDGMYNAPTEGHYTHPERRTVLLKLYPDKAKEIEEARSAWSGEMSFMGKADMVEVVYSWRLPSTHDSGDGCYSVSICTATLEKTEYKKDYFPVVRFQWTEPTYGCFGDGIAKELYGAQRTLTDILRGVCKSIRMFAVPRIWVSKMANVTEQTITNEIAVHTYAGEKPVFDTPPAASGDVYSFIQWIIDWCFKQIGLSQLSAQSEKPAGLNAAVALRTYQNVETQRFAIVGQRWEAFYLDCAKIILDMSADMFEKNKKLSVSVRGRGFIDRINWAYMRLDADQYDIAVFPTSILPETPEGQRQETTELIQSGMMSREDAISQLKMPALFAWQQRETASQDAIDRALSTIVQSGKYVKPTALANLDQAIKCAQAVLLRADEDNIEPHKQDLLWRFLADAMQQKATSQQPAAPPGAGAGGTPAPGGVVGQAAAPPVAPLAPVGTGATSVPVS